MIMIRRWKEVKLGDLIKISHGFNFQSEFFSNEPTPRILITPANFKRGGGFNGSRFKYYNDTGFCPIPVSRSSGLEYILNPGDIIVALTDISHEGCILGCSARVPTIEDKIFLHNQRIGKISVISEDLSPRFLYWLLRTYQYRKHVLNYASNTTVRHTSPSVIKAYRFYLPSKEQQEAIATLLDLLESQIVLLEEGNQKYEDTIMNLCGWFFKKVRKTAPLSDFGRIICGKTPSTAVRHYFDGKIPFIKIPDMRNRVFVTSTDDTLTPEGAATQKNKQIPPHSLCVSCVATVGLVTMTSELSFTNQQINSILPHDRRYLYYLYCALKNEGMTRHLKFISKRGTATMCLNSKAFSEVRIPYPSKQQLQKFNEIAHRSFERILIRIKKADLYIAMRDILLPRLMSGKLSFSRGTKQ